jgi:quinol-cytochrome oxidoreductase complex cytochrome b subunit
MTQMIMIDADFSWTLRGYHNHLRSIVFVVYFLPVT